MKQALVDSSQMCFGTENGDDGQGMSILFIDLGTEFLKCPNIQAIFLCRAWYCESIID